jgi:hypothetical protein
MPKPEDAQTVQDLVTRMHAAAKARDEARKVHEALCALSDQKKAEVTRQNDQYWCLRNAATQLGWEEPKSNDL